MEKALKAERIYNWGVYAVFFICVGAMLFFMSESATYRFGEILVLTGGVYIASHGVIKEFKSEIERLTSDGAADTDPTPPEDE